MKEVEVQMRPVARCHFTQAESRALMKCARLHYEQDCIREALKWIDSEKRHGLLYRISRLIGSNVGVVLTKDELDLIRRILQARTKVTCDRMYGTAHRLSGQLLELSGTMKELTPKPRKVFPK